MAQAIEIVDNKCFKESIKVLVVKDIRAQWGFKRHSYENLTIIFRIGYLMGATTLSKTTLSITVLSIKTDS